MKITCYPADDAGCGRFRISWVAEELKRQGHDIDLRPPDRRDISLKISGNRRRDRDSHTEDVLNVDTDVIVLQRTTHQFMAEAVPILRRKGIAVVIDVDDDLTSIHPRNPAYNGYHPRNQWKISRNGEFSRNSWLNLQQACRDATLVTVSTPALLGIYAKHGRGKVIFNHLPDHYYGVPHKDSDRIGWPAALISHPDDPGVMGGAAARLCADPRDFHIVGDPTGCGTAFGLIRDPSGHDPANIPIMEWPAAVATLGIGISPLADTRFNAAKSWLKPLELSALGVPWVGSPRPEYERLHRMGCGVLAGTPNRWFKELSRMQKSPALREDLAGAGRRVAARFRLEENSWKWLEAWTSAYDAEHHRDPERVVIS